VEKEREKNGERGEIRNSKLKHRDSSLKNPSPVSRPSSPLFAIRTPTALVTDFGTEFGVEVDKNGVTKSHVFRGKVVLTVLDGDAKRNEKLTLEANKSARVERSPGSQSLAVRRHNVDPAGFVRNAQFAARAREIGELPLKPFRSWQAKSEKLRNRKDLLAYYDFQRDPDQPRDENGYELLRNRASTGGKFDGRVMGAIRMGMDRGRFPGKDSLKFTFTSDGVRINIPGEFPQLTLVTSISLEKCDSYSGILMTDKWERADHFHWQFCSGGIIQLSFFNPNGAFPLEVREATDFAGWHVWSMVYDAPGDRTAVYVDGRRLKEWPLSKGPVLRIGEATIGNWVPLDGCGSRPLSGRMDEFAIFTRALDDADIKQLSDNGGGTRLMQEQATATRTGSGSRP
jgi:hypothetical protein